MYLDKAIAGDKKMVEGWKVDADGMLTFVSLWTTSSTSAYDVEIVDWSILCCGRHISFSVYPEYSAKHARYLSVLSRKYLAIFHPVELVQFQPD
jgi:hypothetical protein